jgi:thiamine-monophosphate kinase
MARIRSELDLLRIVSSKPKNPSAILGIGDDCALFSGKRGVYLVTTDMLVEGDHFSLDYFSPFEIGIKSMESNVSDIAAMGCAKPLYAFVSIALKDGTSAEFLREFYRGLGTSAKRHGIDIMGGDTTHGKLMVVNVTLIGFAASEALIRRRSSARAGDLIFVTGKLGASTAGLRLFQRGISGHMAVKRKHTQPGSRMDVAEKVARISHAMEDVSDGLASEVRNICLASCKGAVISAADVPIARETRMAAGAVGESALDFALFGGEDFELVYTVAQKDRRAAEKFGTCVGVVTGGKGIFLEENGKRRILRKFGYDHFIQ